MHLHGLSRSKELVDVFHRVGVCISYVQLCSVCPNEIAEGKPGVIIFDNNDFQNDILTGANTSHRTNVMYVQWVSFENHGPQCEEQVKDVKALLSTLKEIATGMHTQCHHITSKWGKPPVSSRIQAGVESTIAHRKWCAIHALEHADGAGERLSPINQAVPGFAGLISAPIEKSKAITSWPTPSHPRNQSLTMSWWK